MTIALIAVALCSMVIHEWAHAAVADLEGDPVPRDMGRVTLNPFAHLDPFDEAHAKLKDYLATMLAELRERRELIALREERDLARAIGK